MQVTAVAYDNPIPGFHTNNTINLRLWAAKPDREFDLEAFNTGDYVQVTTISVPRSFRPQQDEHRPNLKYMHLALAVAVQHIANINP